MICTSKIHSLIKIMSKENSSAPNVSKYPYPNKVQEVDIIGRKPGDYKNNFRLYLEYCGDPDPNNYWGYPSEERALEYEVKIPAHQEYCICGHDVEKNCYIQHKVNKDLVLVVGIECIKKVMEKKNYLKRCIRCDKLYRGPYERCKECRENIIEANGKINPEFIIIFGKYKGKSIEKLIEDKGYCTWISFQSDDYCTWMSVQIEEQYELIREFILNNLYFNVNFGKYRNRPVKDLLKDRSYCDWIVKQETSQNAQFEFIREYILNNSNS